jgi:hypothetical protein
VEGIWMQAPALLTADERSELRAEAQKEQQASIQRNERPGWRIVDGVQFLGPASFSYSLSGPARLALQPTLAKRLGEAAGLDVVAVQSNYLFYGPGDFLGLHHDQPRCPYTVVALLDGDAEPLCLHPEAVGTEPADLVPLLDPVTHTGGVGVSLADGPLLLAGTRVPHHRDPHGGGSDVTIVTFCFAPPA